jgi:hypothetical protein
LLTVLGTSGFKEEKMGRRSTNGESKKKKEILIAKRCCLVAALATHICTVNVVGM